MIIVPKNKQSIIDVVLQFTGAAENVFDIMLANGFKTLVPVMTDGVLIERNNNSRTVQFYAQNNIFPSNLPEDLQFDFDGGDFDHNNYDFL